MTYVKKIKHLKWRLARLWEEFENGMFRAERAMLAGAWRD